MHKINSKLHEKYNFHFVFFLCEILYISTWTNKWEYKQWNVIRSPEATVYNTLYSLPACNQLVLFSPITRYNASPMRNHTSSMNHQFSIAHNHICSDAFYQFVHFACSFYLSTCTFQKKCVNLLTFQKWMNFDHKKLKFSTETFNMPIETGKMKCYFTVSSLESVNNSFR